MMDPSIVIRPYHGSDERALIELWNSCLTSDPLAQSTFCTRVLLDANFDPEGLLVAEEGGILIGFVLSITRKVPLFLQGLEPETAWITAFGVHPDYRRCGIGACLFDICLNRLADLGRKQVLISPYTPNYFIPGVDTSAYASAVKFLQALGWEITSTPVAMQANLRCEQIAQDINLLQDQLSQANITVYPIQASDLPELMPFISSHFSWDWFRFAQEYLLELFGNSADDVCFLVARCEGKIVGYCQQRRERFGPFGVSPDMRGRGIGRLLLCRCLFEMYARGFHSAWFLWTGKHNQHLYAQAGFEPIREFAVMKYNLDAHTGSQHLPENEG
jgi:ribosomal protein S18 acetylase RimI-like enzyme